MNSRIVVNTGPIIALGVMDAADLFDDLPLEFVSPSQVHAEVEAGRLMGYPVAFPNSIQVTTLRNPPSRLATMNLDSGEAAVIELAIELGIRQVCIDEIKGRRAASALGLDVTGSLGLLGRAKAHGLITEVRPFIHKARSHDIFYDSQLIDEFLHRLGE